MDVRGISGRHRAAAGRGAGGFSLVELLVVIAILCLLVGLISPAVQGARRQASMARCAAQMHAIGAALAHYAAANGSKFPPFAFSDFAGNLPLSGHWGGSGPGGDFGRRGTESVNLHSLLVEGSADARQLICPGAGAELLDGRAGYFRRTSQFSTYCLRMPYSEDVFGSAPSLANWQGRGLLGIYTACAGGQEIPLAVAAPGRPAGTRVRVPQVRFDLPYRERDPDTGAEQTLDWLYEPILSDPFWYRSRHAPAVGSDLPVRAGWIHGNRFNVLFGGGAVHRAADDGTLAANAQAADASPADDGAHHATRAVKVWRHLARAR